MAKKIIAIIIFIVGSIIAFFSTLFGTIHWDAPLWLKQLKQKIGKTRRTFITTLVILILCIIAGSAYYWYLSLSKQDNISANITPPKLTPIEKKLIPDRLHIQFGRYINNEFNTKSVAPLNLLGKEISDGINITPNISGKWHWEDDHELIFTPSIDWPAGQHYSLSFKKNIFANHTHLAKWKLSFHTLAFDALISDFKFYQDPLHPTIKQAYATINFNYPVDVNRLANHINLFWQTNKSDKKLLSYTLSYDEHKRRAYLHSETISLPPVGRYLELKLLKGIKPISGPSFTKEEHHATLYVPDAKNYLNVSNVSTDIARNLKDQPEQVLTIETSVSVKTKALNTSLHAYLLPKDYPQTAWQKMQPNYQWQTPGEVTPSILAQAKPIKLTPIANDRDENTRHSYQYDIATPAFLYVEIDPSLKTSDNFTLAQSFKTILKAKDYPQEISFLHKGALLALGTEEKLSVLIRALPAVKFSIARVLPDDINHLVSQTWGDFNHPYFLSANFNQNNISQIFSHIEQFDISQGKTQYTALDLKKYLNINQTNNSLGLFLLQADGWDVKKNLPLNVQANRLILITDLGLIVKDNRDETHDIFVQSITNGTPVSSATVSILGKNGLAILTKTTDSLGHVSFPSLKDFINEQEPTVYLVRLHHDVAFIPYNRFDRQLNYSRFDVSGITQQPNALTAYLFSDRGIYRPGDTAHLGMIIKKAYAMPQLSNLPLQITITDPQGVNIKDEKITTNDNGLLTIDLKTQATSKTGNYLVNLYIVKDHHPSNLIGSTYFQVEEFLPDRMRISAQLSKKSPGWISPTDLKATIGLWNLYGSPAKDHRISAKILLSPKVVQFKEFPDYIFFDPLFDSKHPAKVLSETLTDIHTNDLGEAEFDLQLDRFTQATYQLTLFSEGFELEGGRSVTAQKSALVSPLAYLVGYKNDGDLTYIKQNAVRNIRLIAINPKLKAQALPDLTLSLFKLQPMTTLVKKEDGTYEYQSVIQRKKIDQKKFSILEHVTDYSLPTKDIGDFLLTISDKKNVELAKLKYSVVGMSQKALPKNAELNVKLNRSLFNSGDEIEMQISAPYTGAGLITIERDKVYASRWFKTNSLSSLQKIKIPSDFQGNGYVNIAFVRDLNSPEIFMSPLSYSVIPFSVTHQNHAMQLNLSLKRVVKPGEILPITYRSDRKGKAIIFAVDEGILQVSQYKTPDPLNFFFQKQALDVRTSQIVDQILPKFIASRERSAIGGDGGKEELFAKHLNPFKRQTDAPVVFWSGIVDIDNKPRQLTYSIPDYFNGKLRVIVVAVTKDAVGSLDKQAEVRGDFIINPNMPTFVAPNDEFDISISVANNLKDSGNNAPITLTIMTTPQLKLLSSSQQTITIPEGGERSIHFKVKATDLLGAAKIEFIAQYKEHTSKISSSLSVRPARVYDTNITSGFARKTKSLSLNRELYPAYRNVKAAIAANPLILLSGINEYLAVYPYDCTEQLVSKAFSLLIKNNQPDATQKESVNDKIKQIIQQLIERQLSSGGFKYWPGESSASNNDFASIYAMHFLTEAREEHYPIPQDIFASGIHFLKDFIVQNTNDLDKARLQAYAIYLLTRNEIITTNYLTHLQLSLEQFPKEKWQNDITSAYLAATYQLLKNHQEANRLIAFYQPKTSKQNTDFYNQNIADAQYLYLLAKHFQGMLTKVEQKLISSLTNALNNDEMNTLLSAYTTLAFSAYQPEISFQSTDTFSLIETLANGKQNTLATAQHLDEAVPLGVNAKKISFQNSSAQGYFYQLIQAGFDKNFQTKSVSHGIEVYRELQNTDHQPISTIKLGDEVIVSIRARALDRQYYDHIAIVDLLASGFEPVRDSIHPQNMEYVDVREDRVIFFGSLSTESKEITYKIKATTQGQFTLPPIFATSMYRPFIKSIGVTSHLSVTE